STLALVLPLVSALTLNTPTGVTTGGTVTLTWTATTEDPTSFTFELYNTIFHDTFAIQNTVQTSLGTITLQFPQIPVGDGYTLQAVANNNVNQVYAQSGDFSVGAQTTPSTTMVSTTSNTASTAQLKESELRVSCSSASSVSTVPTTTSPTLSTTSSTTSTGTSATSTPTSFGNGASSFKFGLGVGPTSAVILSAVAGAIMAF
ncbi:hypothetical protein BU15DRAFT_51449, partial [Melanogaster broomeanus]